MKQIKVNSVRESSPNILKTIIQIAKKYVNGGVIDTELAEFLIKHDWKKYKQQIQDFIQSNKLTN
jgi:dissimilatory sulfite reductase (desulfoviridin) alpha/beta subunit